MNDNFVREFDVDSKRKTLNLYQGQEGDVNCVVWDASIVLAKYLEKICETKPNFFENLNVIELGAGVGCAGLTAACLGANVLLTDLPEALPLLKLNIEKNKSNWQCSGGNAKAVSLTWSEELDVQFSPDLILLADCVYYKESIDYLVKTLNDLATLDTKIIFSQEIRDSQAQEECWEYYTNQISKYFTCENIPLSEQNAEYCSPDILLIKLIKL